MRHNQNEYTKFTQDKLGVVGLSYQNWLCRNTNARLFFTSFPFRFIAVRLIKGEWEVREF